MGVVGASGAYSSVSRRPPIVDWAAVLGPKALARHRFRPLAAAVAAIGLAVVVYRSQSEAGFAILVLLGGAAAWLLAVRIAGIIAAAEIAALVGCVWSGFISLPAALFQVLLLTALIGLAHVAADREPVVRRSAVQERRIHGLTLLLETAEALATAGNREEILNVAVLASARGISRAGHDRPSHAAFHSVVGEQINISIVADDPLAREIAVGFEYPIASNKAAGAASRIGRPAFVRPDHMSGPLRELADRLGWQVLIMAPVYSSGALQGLMAATTRDGPVVEPLQQYMLGILARLTSLRLESAAKMEQYVTAAQNTRDEPDVPMLVPALVNELRDAVQPIKNQILDLRASRDRANQGDDDTFGKLDGLISALASRTAIDPTTGVLNRELGLAALERDVMRARRSQGSRHCVAVLSVATAAAPDGAELIRLVADRLRAGLRRDDLIFRNADSEFVCSFADMDSADAGPILSRIQMQLAGEIGYTPFAIGLAPVALEQTAG
ncbi:MAG TPA: hypothetical protein VFK22_02640 [Candidatus Dormibacteraeota bacterium]|nr:hypothetical protein [Candidatus Dormibacteraeota bacterium]